MLFDLHGGILDPPGPREGSERTLAEGFVWLRRFVLVVIAGRHHDCLLYLATCYPVLPSYPHIPHHWLVLRQSRRVVNVGIRSEAAVRR